MNVYTPFLSSNGDACWKDANDGYSVLFYIQQYRWENIFQVSYQVIGHVSDELWIYLSMWKWLAIK